MAFATLSVVLAVLSLAVAAPAAGQEGLASVDALAAAGRTEEARAVLETWWDSERTRSSRRDRQRGLWLRAVLTVDPGMASLDYQRLVVEYPGGPYSDEALVRLAMIADSHEDALRAARYYRTLLQDYPRSPERVRARQWLSNHSGEIEETEEEAPSAADSAADVEDEDAPAQEGGRYAVQFGAFSTEERADRLAETLAQAGFETRVVRVQGSSLVRVRVGRFAERSAASELMAEIESLGYAATVVSDVMGEEPIR